MSRLLTTLRPHLRSAFSLGGLFLSSPASTSSTSSTVSRLTRDVTKTKYVLRTPPSNPAPPREVPTPLVFVSAEGWDGDSAKGMESFASMYAERGYTTLEIDIAPPASQPATSQALLKHFEDELRAHIRLLSIPFAPVIVSRGAGTLIAQAFVESNPASGLVLVDPPVSNDVLYAEGWRAFEASDEGYSEGTTPPVPPPTTSNKSGLAESAFASAKEPLLPTPLPEFRFEPMFPIAILATPTRLSTLRESHRLLKPAPESAPDAAPVPKSNRLLGGLFGGGGGRGRRGRWEVDVIQVQGGDGTDGLDGQEAFVGIEKWLDSIGV